MFMNTLVTFAALMPFALSAQVSGSQGGNTPVAIIKYHPTHLVPGEATIAERVDAVDLVILLRIVGPVSTRAVDITDKLHHSNPGIVLLDPQVIPITEYSADVLQVFKHSAAEDLSGVMRLCTTGGDADWGGRRVVGRKRSPDLVSGGTYLVFLRYSVELEMPVFQDEDVFRLDGTQASASLPASQTEYGKSIIGRSPGEVLEMLRAATAPKAP
jgi:hypothetical protein